MGTLIANVQKYCEM